MSTPGPESLVVLVHARHVESVRSGAGAPRRQRRLPRGRDPLSRRRERVREVDVAGDRERLSRPRRGRRRDRRTTSAPRDSRRGPEARSRHRVPDLLAPPRPLGGREPLPRRARRRPAHVRAHAEVGGVDCRGVRARRPGEGARRVAVARATTASRGRQVAAREAEGAPARRADDGARARGGRATPRPRQGAKQGRGRNRLREPPAPRGARDRRPHQRASRRREAGDVRRVRHVGRSPGRAD